MLTVAFHTCMSLPSERYRYLKVYQTLNERIKQVYPPNDGKLIIKLITFNEKLWVFTKPIRFNE